jgi:DNA recombination protein RmuC
MIVRLPGGREIVVDSKAPLAAYFDACDATTPQALAGARRRYVRALRSHVRKLAARGYAARLDRSPDFVVMYLPGEHLLGAALEHDSELIEQAQAQGVLIATPTTLIALLKTVAHVWQHEQAATHVREIVALARELHARVQDSLRAVDLVSRRLNMTVTAHNDAVAQVHTQVLPVARRFGEIAGSGGPALPCPARVDRRAREATAREGAAREPVGAGR